MSKTNICKHVFFSLVSMLWLLNVSFAANPYKTQKVLIPTDEAVSGQLQSAPLFKPHETASPQALSVWITSNERTGCAGITVFNSADQPLKNLIIDEPGVAYEAGEEATGQPCVGSLLPPSNNKAASLVQFPTTQRLNPAVCLPVVLPPGSAVPVLQGKTVKSLDKNRICAPLAAESHSRHPHGIKVDSVRKMAYQVIEHSGLRWNANRTGFEVAVTTDEEAGLLLAYDITQPAAPNVVNGWLLGHAAEEDTVNEANGKIFAGNHEDAPGVYPNIWVSVIDPSLANPYGFIDTGYFNAVQGVEIDPSLNLVFGTTHVGEKMFAFDGNCVPTANAAGVIPPPPPPGFTLPTDTNMQSGWNCIAYWVDLRPAFVSAYPAVASALLAQGIILHMHDLTADATTHRAYQSLHSIHDAEHTGLPTQEPPPGKEKGIDSEEIEAHGNARWVVEVENDPKRVTIAAQTKKAAAPVHIIDVSNGYDILSFPNVDDILTHSGLSGLEASFVHAHFLALDPTSTTLFVTGEHTGNVGVVDTASRRLQQVIPITIAIPACTPPPPEPGSTATPEEPHVHGVSVKSPGLAYISDEGESCYYESVTILKR